MSRDIVDRLHAASPGTVDEALLIDAAAEVTALRWLVEQFSDLSDDLVDHAGHLEPCEMISGTSDDDCTCGYEDAVETWEDLCSLREREPDVLAADRWREIADRLFETLARSPQALVSIEGRAAVLAYQEASRG